MEAKGRNKTRIQEITHHATVLCTDGWRGCLFAQMTNLGREKLNNCISWSSFDPNSYVQKLGASRSCDKIKLPGAYLIIFMRVILREWESYHVLDRHCIK